MVFKASTREQVIGYTDQPAVNAPAYFDEAVMPGTGDYAITSFDCTLNFTDYVCAGILDPAASPSFAPLLSTYTELASVPWSLNMSGTFQNFAWAANGAGVTLGAGAPGNSWR